MYPKISHFLLPTLLIIAGSFAAHIGGAGWYAAGGLWALSFATVLWIDIKTVYDGRYEHRRATAEMCREAAKLTSEQLDQLGLHFPELRMNVQPVPHISLDSTGVSLTWFRDVFMARSNPVSTVSLHSFEGPGRNVDRANWYKVTQCLARYGMFVGSPNSNHSYLWRSGSYEYLLTLAGYQGYSIPNLALVDQEKGYTDEAVE